MKRLTDKELVAALRNCSDAFVYCNDCPAFDICDGGTVAPPMELLREAASRLEARPIRSGHWIEEYVYAADPHDRIRYKCSVCGRTEENKEPYCNCGAKMI